MNDLIVIMGMHRSGTSMVGELVGTGFKILNDMPANKDNEHGYFESIEVMNMNNVLLFMDGGSWYNVPDKFSHTMEFNFDCQAIKDPRFCITYPAWEFPKHRIIKVIRDREAVVRSLCKRDGFSKDLSGDLYDTYNSRMSGYTDVPYLEVHYEDLLQDIGELEDFLDTELDDSVIDRKLNHFESAE